MKFSVRCAIATDIWNKAMPEQDEDTQQQSFWEVMKIVLAGHLGVRKRVNREDDFQRANGLQVFVAAAVYFIVIVVGLVFLVRYLTA